MGRFTACNTPGSKLTFRLLEHSRHSAACKPHVRACPRASTCRFPGGTTPGEQAGTLCTILKSAQRLSASEEFTRQKHAVLLPRRIGAQRLSASEEFTQPHCPSFQDAPYCAQRLSASEEFTPPASEDFNNILTVLNAFRHQRNLHKRIL